MEQVKVNQDEIEAIHAMAYYFGLATQEENDTTRRGQKAIQSVEKKFRGLSNGERIIWK